MMVNPAPRQELANSPHRYLLDEPEMSVNNKRKLVEFKKNPTTIFIRPSLSKIKKQYFVFLAEEGCEYRNSNLSDTRSRQETCNTYGVKSESINFYS
ncbi:MAG: hypothetical protein ACREBU_14085 [Nitrososphaera sp.]